MQEENLTKKAKGNLHKCKNISVKINFTPNFIGDIPNDSNPENGHELCFAMSDKASENIKTSLSNMFNIEADYNIIKILNKEDIKYPQVKNFIQDICNNNL